MKKRNRKGFTLIELLAVIVILGLLMAIAIPSVTRYITQSRKKTVVSTIGNYIGAVTTEVNDLTYAFTGNNTVYALPIECIQLERGGTSPLGLWHQANDDYWAYVLVQYDDDNSKYTYGYTFKDSNGNGMYPTVQSKIDSKGEDIKTGLNLTRPTNGDITSIAAVDKWVGFDVDSDTDLVILEALSEGKIGDGEKTCTLRQKGQNYDEVVENKKEDELTGIAYAIYSDVDRSLTFVRSETEIKVGDVYEGITVTKVYTDFEDKQYDSRESLPWHEISAYRVVVKDKIQPVSTAYWFYGWMSCAYLDVANIDTSKVTDMSYMFHETGFYTDNFIVVGMNKWDTSKVTDMSYMFSGTGYGASTFDIGDLSNWKTGNVENMTNMFSRNGGSSTFELDLGNWDVSKVTDMSYMFQDAGYNATTWSIGDLSEWVTTNVTTMAGMFSGAGHNATTFNLMLRKWDTSKVENMSGMFRSAGYKASTFSLVGLDNDNWKTSKVTDMSGMFDSSGYNATTWSIGNLSGWDLSSVTKMNTMFCYAGYSASYELDLREWKVPSSVNHASFNYGVTNKVLAPTFG